MDLGPTILGLMGNQIEGLHLERNLLSDNKTMVELPKQIDTELRFWSRHLVDIYEPVN
jgi:hypothetical protein